MWQLIGVLGLLAFLAGIVGCVFFLFKRNWDRAKKLSLLATAGIILFIVGASNDGSTETTKQQTEKDVISQEESESKKIAASTDDQTKDYINNELDSFIRSVSANVDTNWKFYFVEPVERLEQDGNLEAFVSDVSLLVDLYRGIASQVDSLETAEYLTDEDKKDIADIKDGLISAINKRIEVAETLIGMSDAMEILSTDITETLEESNEYLQSAANAYGSLLNRY